MGGLSAPLSAPLSGTVRQPVEQGLEGGDGDGLSVDGLPPLEERPELVAAAIEDADEPMGLSALARVVLGSAKARNTLRPTVMEMVARGELVPVGEGRDRVYALRAQVDA